MTSDPGDQNPVQPDEGPTGGSETTEAELEADNAVEEDMLKAVGPEAPPD
jgi:hypothetical protein